MDEIASMELMPVEPVTVDPIPAFAGGNVPGDLREAIGRAVAAWLLRTPSPHTRRAYQADLDQFLDHSGIAAGAFEHLPQVRPEHVSQWRDGVWQRFATNWAIGHRSPPPRR